MTPPAMASAYCSSVQHPSGNENRDPRNDPHASHHGDCNVASFCETAGAQACPYAQVLLKEEWLPGAGTDRAVWNHAQVAGDARVDLRFLPADDAVRRHMRHIGCSEAFELGSVKCASNPIACNPSFLAHVTGAE
jgi:hypothetical protein